ncbi:MAG: DUF2325 domain-containing protein [Acidovorax sp.]
MLTRRYAALQRRCTELLQVQAREIAQLQGQVLRLRAQAVVQCSAWAWEREDGLMEKLPAADLGRLEHSLRAADLVICQTGCVGHGAFWRVQDHCKRTGKTCVLVEQPDALRIVRIHPASVEPAA